MTYATGKVLEVGIGTAENMKYYTNEVEVSKYFGLDLFLAINRSRLV